MHVTVREEGDTLGVALRLAAINSPSRRRRRDGASERSKCSTLRVGGNRGHSDGQWERLVLKARADGRAQTRASQTESLRRKQGRCPRMQMPDANIAPEMREGKSGVGGGEGESCDTRDPETYLALAKLGDTNLLILAAVLLPKSDLQIEGNTSVWGWFVWQGIVRAMHCPERTRLPSVAATTPAAIATAKGGELASSARHCARPSGPALRGDFGWSGRMGRRSGTERLHSHPIHRETNKEGRSTDGEREGAAADGAQVASPGCSAMCCDALVESESSEGDSGMDSRSGPAAPRGGVEEVGARPAGGSSGEGGMWSTTC